MALWTNIYLAPNMSTWLFLIPLLLGFYPNSNNNRVRLKETLYFTGLISMAKQMHITTIIKKNTTLEKTAQEGVEPPILLWLGGGSGGCLRLKGGSEMNLQSNSS